jgi:peptide chain release factor 3
MQYRLQDEYHVSVDFQILPYECSAWIIGDAQKVKLPSNALLVSDQINKPLALFNSAWEKQYAMQQNPEHQFLDMQN